MDLGSGGPVVLPDSVGSAAHPHLLLGASKTGTIYLMDRENMGHFNALGDTQIVQNITGAVGGMWLTPACFNGMIYYVGLSDVIKAFAMSGGMINTNPTAQGTTTFGGGATPCISANGTNNAIVWALQVDYSNGGLSVLHAFNATNVAQELYNSSQLASRDNAGGVINFIVPTIANGKVYVGGSSSLSVYGNAAFLANPVIAPNGGAFTNSVTVTLTDATPGTAIYYTLDGTVPTTNSILYGGSFVLTNSTSIQAVATKSGALNSPVAGASFINSSSIGAGSGLIGSYWSNVTSVEFTEVGFAIPATLVRTDAVVNFNWGTGSPDPSISADQFTVRWTGAVQPQFSENYTFTTTTDDGVRLWVNNELIIDKWVVQAATSWSGSINLTAQQRYNIKMEYFENTDQASAQLSWSSPSTPMAIIPQSQLYPVSNPPPTVVLTGPANGATFTASASMTLAASATAQYNAISSVAFYANATLLGIQTNGPYILTATGLAAGSYALTAIVSDATGLTGTSAPVNITITPGTGLPYGLTSRTAIAPFLNLPNSINGSMPATLSQTGVFTNTASLGHDRRVDSLQSQYSALVRCRSENPLAGRAQQRRALHHQSTNCVRADRRVVFPQRHGLRETF